MLFFVAFFSFLVCYCVQAVNKGLDMHFSSKYCKYQIRNQAELVHLWLEHAFANNCENPKVLASSGIEKTKLMC